MSNEGGGEGGRAGVGCIFVLIFFITTQTGWLDRSLWGGGGGGGGGGVCVCVWVAVGTKIIKNQEGPATW